ncbi:MAG: hypothetical protein HY075_15235, partial [Deltaproteobacteria bacterium]|nr:hypothetical protein [Deltaproteobacteria bacterium]
MRSLARTFLHLARRDLDDNLLQWVMLGAISVVALPIYFRMSLFDQLRSPLPVGYFFATFLYDGLYLQTIWGDNQHWGASLPRFYLQTLPVPRLHVFALGFLRGFVGGIPMAAWGAFLLPR